MFSIYAVLQIGESMIMLKAFVSNSRDPAMSIPMLKTEDFKRYFIYSVNDCLVEATYRNYKTGNIYQ